MRTQTYFDSVAGFFRNFPPEIVRSFGFLVAALHVVVWLVLTLAVVQDARSRRDGAKQLFLIGPWMWGLVVLMTGGYAGALGYWLIHYSALRQNREEKG
jgi:hypothetical protein